jgi:hypothetical protein
MYSKFVLIIVFVAGMLTGCNLTSAAVVPTHTPTTAPTLEFIEPSPIPLASFTSAPTPVSIPASATPLSSEQAVLQRAAEVVAALKDENMTALAGYVLPQIGLRFSPYAAVKDTDQVIRVDKIDGLMADSTIYVWGAYDGSGEPIELTFPDYYPKFIYDVDFANAPQLALNHRLGVSTTLDNSAEFYPSAMIVEYYYPGFDPKLEGMDWRSLRLVFIENEHNWYLVGIIHDQWTT